MESRPPNLEAAITAVANASSVNNAYDRLDRAEEPIEVSGIGRKVDLPSDASNKALSEAFKALVSFVDKLSTKVDKYKGASQAVSSPRVAKSSRISPKFNDRGEPRCFACDKYGHVARDCRRSNQGNE